MITKEYTTVDKSGWGRGPWDNEVDKKQWIDDATGLPCLLVRNPDYGHFCGYVGVPSGHPCYGVQGYEDAQQREHLVDSLSCHGGVTFTGTCRAGVDESESICHLVEPGEPDDVWWISFDCAHGWDFKPGEEYHMHKAFKETGHPYIPFPVDLEAVYRNQKYVEAECAELAKQLKEMEVA